MTPHPELPDGFRRMIETLAQDRQGTPEMVRRATALCRQFKFSPWVAWAVVERKVALTDAARLDGAAKCPALQGAVLDHQVPLPELETKYPYAPYFLTHDLTTAGGGPFRRVSDALFVAKALLAGERILSGTEALQPTVRTQPVEHYRGIGRQILSLRENEGLSLETATDVVLGLMPLAVARRRLALRREGERRKAFDADPRDGRSPDRSGRARSPLADHRPESARPGPRHRELQDDRYT